MDLSRLTAITRAMKSSFAVVITAFVLFCSLSIPQLRGAAPASWSSNLPVYDHIVIVIEENKNYEQVIEEQLRTDPAFSPEYSSGGVRRIPGGTRREWYRT